MAIWSRLKSMAGGHGPLTTLASAATRNIPDDDDAYYISGTTTITSLLTAPFLRSRRVTFIGAAAAVVTFTNTNTPTTSGQMYLHGQNRTIQEDDVIELFCKANGTWILMNLIN